MNRPSKQVVWSLAALLCLVTAQAQSVIVNDPFTDGGRTNGADPLDIPWFSLTTSPVLSVVDDSGGLGSGNALQAAPDTNVQLVGVVPTITTLANVGESLVLTMDFRFNVAPVGSFSGFRFGLFNSNGTSVTGDNSGVAGPAANDFGYGFTFGTGAASNNAVSIFKSASGVPLASTGGSITATGTPFTVSNALAHHLQITLTRLTATSLGIEFRFDGSVVATATDASSPFISFDEIYAVTNAQSGRNYLLDNVTLQFIPEPSVGALLAIGGFAAAILLRKRQNRARIA